MAVCCAGAANAEEPKQLVVQAAGQSAEPASVVVAAAGQAASAPESDSNEPSSLNSVTVRSRISIEKLQDVPKSISVVQGKELDRLNAYEIGAITRRAANVTWNQGNQRTSSLSIRGIGFIGQTEAQDPSVGVVVDGVSYAYNALSSSYDFFDVDTVEVARGPQGTLSGKNASVGTISINTRRPSFTPTADYSLTFSQRDGIIGQLAAGGPVIDHLLAWRGTFSVNRQRGDISNSYNGDNTYTNTDRASARVQFLLTPTPDLNVRLEADLQPRAAETTNARTIYTPTPKTYANGAATPIDTAGRLSRRWFTEDGGFTLGDFYYGGRDGKSVANDGQLGLVTGSHGATTEVNWKLPTGHTLTSITAYKDYHFNAVNDEGSPFNVYRNSGGFLVDYSQTSQELRIASPTGGAVDYQGGLYYIQVHNRSEYQRAYGDDGGAYLANNAQYKTLDADASGRYLLLNSVANLTEQANAPEGYQNIKNKSAAAFGQLNWHLTEQLALTAGLRATRESRNNTVRSVITNQGSAPELNGVSFINKVTGVVVPLGGFSSDAKGVLDPTKNSAAQLSLADFTANRYFGTVITGTPGAAYNSLTAGQMAQIAAAKAIRQAQIGILFPDTAAQSFQATQPSWVVGPTYKLDDDLTTYLTWQHGEKAGIAQFVNGVSTPVKAEKTNNFELGFKSALLDKSLIFNADVFLSRITDYQQAIRFQDPYQTAVNNDGSIAYVVAPGNVPKVQVHGLEIDGVYTGVRNLALRFSGAYNKAVYKDFTDSPQPVENGYLPATQNANLSGRPLPGAARFTYNVGGDYRVPVWTDKEFHSSANVAFTSSYYSDTALSAYSVIPKNYLVDWAVGLGNRNNGFDVSLLVKNLFGNDTPTLQTWNSYSPAIPRTFSIVFSGRI